jgi:hypothetical protein
MMRKLTERQLARFYRMLSVRMTDFDCGRRCAPNNGDIPYCCDGKKVVPILYRDEYKWLRTKKKFWRKMPIKTAFEKKLIQDTCYYNVFALCPGVQDCRRTLRALVCRLFPFEPFLDERGFVLGLVYQDGENEQCPLVGKPQRIYNPQYIKNSIRVWQELVDTFPEEKDMYVRESRKRARRATRLKKSISLFK